ncbi:hypothetical protein A3A93_00975 [Candidatus Roizmanbacteria bacterium RIFCSPLOWO2_01_FULL_38_12]|uniref:Response regulatory domain-containing protein n=1 Tax=Candidatus Roizmanbacteria bacterium RIFCSPLOWO2_01_FULL_38_12 TaxID=1802061 RepID=A0A1F7IR84_9BACT|nr:MAG: hypothetical protein A2861_01770 [Candidatus Roizmanbacteria bacterium RIFCSPHIGHO2_01_FULL_38_15]OGK34748.1 MAG: hypothetical protein A3F59_04435 [Candidatus Roizmanbacteria bacterium RIFCSPHIGHO2_12_FULL_38_13]OGK45866.1 MAG: hypothetical protein A3A93_00975 [Candidatus Roizmanbacteria bacterium RIFCSPLOWO2_01_FULL_38_12]
MENQNNPQIQRKKILIIEDEKAIARAIEIKLNKTGYLAKAVFDGETGLKELGLGGYDLVLLDIMMPIIDGWSVLSKIKERNIQVKVIITSNLNQDEDARRAKEMGAVGFLVKSNASLTNIIDEVKNFL